MERTTVIEQVSRAIEHASDKKGAVTEHQRLVEDLGFDSLRMSRLSLSLEKEFGRPVLLNEWIASADDPHNLTVGSLTDFMIELLAAG